MSVLARAVLVLTALVVTVLPAAAGPDDIVIIIANQDYRGTVPKVEYADRDGEAFAKAAREVLRVPADRIIVERNLTYAGFLGYFGRDGEGGPELQRLKARLGRASTITFFYSGHGMPAKRSAASDPEAFLLPVDTPPSMAATVGYAVGDIRKSLGNAQRANSPEGRVVLYLDACFTGSSGAGWIAAETSSVRISPSAIRAAEPRVVELAASGSDQEANWDRERRLGIFTDALVEGLYGAADLDRDGHVTAAELSAFLARRIDHRVTRLFPSPRRYQTPSLSGDGAARLASISASTPSRDPEATARLAVRCATVPKSSDAAEVREFLGNCGAECPCLPALEVRLRELETAATACRVEGEELERLTKRGSAARAQIEALAASATCAEVKARAVGVISGIATAPPGTPPTPEARQPSRIVPPAPPPARGESRVSVKSVVRVRQPFTVPGCGIVIVPTRTARHLGQQVYEGGIAVDGKNMLVRTGTLLTPLSPSGGCKLFVVLRPSGDIELDGECSCSDPSAPPSPGTSAPTPSGTSAPSKFFRDNRLDHTSCTECPEMAVIPVGTFVMGTVEAAGQTERSELPARKISFTKSFALGRHEVTFDEWDACVATKMCTLRPADEGWGRGRQPVVNVTANAISEYLTFLAAITGQSYRLPTEAEWEYAARAGAATRFSTGDTLTAKDANVERSRGRAVPVGSYAANAFGLFDMHGNVWEIVGECWNPTLTHRWLPEIGGPPIDSKPCGEVVMRGGSWNFPAIDARASIRQPLKPDYGVYSIGFRVARDLPN